MSHQRAKRSTRALAALVTCVGMACLAPATAAYAGQNTDGNTFSPAFAPALDDLAAPGPNGQIAFDATDPQTGGFVTWITDADGSNQVKLPIAVDGGVPHWSPDGSKLLLATFSDLGLRPATVNPDGTGLAVLAVPELPAFMDISPCVWVPSGARILCKAQNFNTPDHSLDGIYSMTSAGTDVVRLTTNPFPPADPFGGGDQVGDVSPDGQQFVFMRARPDKGRPPGREQSGALFVENINGTGLRQITQYGMANSHDDGTESWSPDGSKILFATAEGELKTIHPDGTQLAALPIKAAGGVTFAGAPSWSPDGTHIVMRLFLGSVGRADIYTMRSNGTQLTNLTQNTPADFVNNADWGTAQPG